MRIKVFATISLLLLLSFAATQLTNAQTVKGTYQFSSEDGYTKYVEFDAATQADGSTVGSMFYSDEALVSYQDLDGTGDPSFKESYKGFSIKVAFDGLLVNKNQAVMSGTIKESNISSLIGQRVLLTVEDNGDNTREPDKLTWGVYKPVERDWKPSDAEWKEDPGVGLTWRATDDERKDDEGIMMPKDEAITSQSFPVSSYTFIEVQRGAGDIQVQP
jgi:hypothetical protein